VRSSPTSVTSWRPCCNSSMPAAMSPGIAAETPGPPGEDPSSQRSPRSPSQGACLLGESGGCPSIHQNRCRCRSRYPDLSSWPVPSNQRSARPEVVLIARRPMQWRSRRAQQSQPPPGVVLAPRRRLPLRGSQPHPETSSSPPDRLGRH
jgi:hypothetical protein